MVEQTTGRAIRGVYGTDESPGFWQQLADGGSLHLGEVLTSVDTSEMGQVSSIVELICHHGEASCLL